jgi:hypothetical protein
MSSTIDTNTASRDLFLADLDRLEESIWRNEDIGEKRFNFFVSLATAVGGGLAVVWASDRTSEAFRAALTTLTPQALVALLVFGLVSYLRMIHRDKVTAEYKRDTKMVRRKYREVFQAECPELKEYKLEHEIKQEIKSKADALDNHRKRRLRDRWKRMNQMGYTQTLAVMNGILLATVLISTAALSMPLAALAGFVLGALLSFGGAKPHDVVK